MIRNNLIKLVRNANTMEHVMIQTGLGSILSITTLIRATFFVMSLATIAPADKVAACSAQHQPGQPAAYENTGQGSSGGFLA
jgi:hypothetical protein